MKKMLVAIVLPWLLSSGLWACGGKNKGSNTPANKDKATEMKTGATGGAAYGGQGSAQPQPQKDAPNPCAPK